MISDSGSIGVSGHEISEKTNIRFKNLSRILQELRNEKKIFFRLGINRWLSIEQQTRQERATMEWTVG